MFSPLLVYVYKPNILNNMTRNNNNNTGAISQNKSRRNKTKNNNRQKAGSINKMKKLPKNRPKVIKSNISNKPSASKQVNASNTKFNVKSHLQEATEALLLAKPFILPRFVPTNVYQLNTFKQITLDNCDSAVIIYEPRLRYPLTVIKEKSVEQTEIFTWTDAGVQQPIVHSENPGRSFYLALELTSTDGSTIPYYFRRFPNFEHYDQYAIVQNNLDREFVYVQSNSKKVPLFCGQLKSGSAGDLRFYYDYAVGSASYKVQVKHYDENYVELGSNTLTLTGSAGNYGDYSLTAVTTFTGAKYFAIVITDDSNQAGDAPRIEGILGTYATFNIGNTNISASEYDYYEGFNMDTIAEKWSLTSASLLLTNTASAMYNGGQAAIALVPGSFELPRTSVAAYNQISSLPYNRYYGRAADGAHASWLPEQIDQYFFKDLTNEGMQLNDAPTIVAVLRIPAQQQELNMSFQIQLRANLEFIIPSPNFKHVVSSNHIDLLTAIMGKIRSVAIQQNGSPLVTENPRHITKIKEMAKKIASDPHLQQLAKQVLSTLGKSAAASIPMLLAAL